MSGSAIAGPSRYGGFSPLPVLLPQPASVPWKATPHYLWIRPDRTAGKAGAGAADDAAALPAGRTLFVANLPADCEEADLREVFVEFGAVERVVFKVAETGRGEEQWADEGSEEESSEEEDADEDDNNAGDDGGGWKDASELQEEFEIEVGESAAPAAAAAIKPTRKQRRERRIREPVAPTVVPLPSLNPRALPFLPVCSSAYLVFLDPLSLQRAISVAPTRKPKLLTRSHASPTGLAYFTALRRTQRPPMGLITAHADSAIALFDHHAALASARASKGAITDDDGFTLVVRGGRFGRTAGKGAQGVGVASRRFMLESKKVKGLEGAEVDAREGLLHGKEKKKRGVVDGFYRFQRHEQRRQELADMRKAFEADKAKIADLKSKNRYKPY